MCFYGNVSSTGRENLGKLSDVSKKSKSYEKVLKVDLVADVSAENVPFYNVKTLLSAPFFLIWIPLSWKFLLMDLSSRELGVLCAPLVM